MRQMALILSILALAAPAAAEPPAWTVDHDESRIGFVTQVQNAPVNGVFETWTADIRFDPDDLGASRVVVEIETGSVDTNYADRDRELVKPAWFSVEMFPKATFQAETFAKTGDGAYTAEGTLTIKGVEQPITLPFTLAFDGDAAHLQGGLDLRRLAFNIGEGEWSATTMLKDEVRVEIELNARKTE